MYSVVYCYKRPFAYHIRTPTFNIVEKQIAIECPTPCNLTPVFCLPNCVNEYQNMDYVFRICKHNKL